MKRATALIVCITLTYVLLTSNPWSLFGWVPLQHDGDMPCCILDKAYHFAGYFGLSLALLWYAAQRARWEAMTLVAFAFTHAISTEYLQRFVPERTSDWKDLAANVCGIVVGSCLGLVGRHAALHADPESVEWAGSVRS